METGRQNVSLEAFKVSWQELYPNTGDDIANFLYPLVGWKPELAPLLPDIQTRLDQGLFWGRAPVAYRAILQSQSETIEDSIAISIIDSLESSLGRVDWEKTKMEFVQSQRSPLGVMMGATLVLRPLDALPQLLYYAVYPLMQPSPNQNATQHFEPMRDLWIAGNFPLGFDKRGNLILLVADGESTKGKNKNGLRLVVSNA